MTHDYGLIKNDPLYIQGKQDMKDAIIKLCESWDFNVQGLIRQIQELK